MLGDLSKKYESNGDPACISTGYGDAGGKSYGMYQLASGCGSVHNYLGWAKRAGYWFADKLMEHTVGSAAFDSMWRFLGTSANRDDFERSQHEYIKYSYYEPAVSELAVAGYNINGHTNVMRDVVWSRAVQYGPAQIVDMFTEAGQYLGYPNLSYVDAASFDAAMIEAVYLHVCSTPEWTNGSPDLRAGLYARFKNECAEALERLSD